MPEDISSFAEECVKTQHKPTESADKIISENSEPEVEVESSHISDTQEYAKNPDGTIKLNKDGTYQKKKGRKKGSVNGQSVSTGEYNAGNQQSRMAAKAITNAMFLSCVSIFGDEWKPIIDENIGLNEPQNIEDAWTAYFDSAGMKEIPPWAVLIFAMGSYSLPRLTQPKTQNRLQKIVSWISEKIGKKKVKQ